ncbi:MAG TPA: bifunctional diguanylate cyclase/phosphohydrolase [Candidatus Tripitaka californicus]|uniref:bifunctional diguanylate cyclase/phosphohydrolase n=1 Tax=Candidatus Tripitaka californicus TaxID=3367616 RepID=UPI00402516CF|nr:diguanylate cyclase [Planctomycetota bacterium]
MGNNPKKKPGFSLSSKLLCILIPLLVLLAASLGIIFYLLIDIGTSLPTVHAARLLRSELMRMHFAAGGLLLEEETRKEIEELQEEVRTYLYALRDGNKALGIKASPGRLEEPDHTNLWWNWDRHIRHYEETCQPLLSQLLKATTYREKEDVFPRYNKEADAFLWDVDRTCIMTTEHFMAKPFVTFSWSAPGLIIASIAVGISTYFLIHLFIKRPLRALTGGIEEVTRGKWGKTVEVKTRDELGRLAQSFNTLSLELEKTIKALETEKLELEEANKKLQASSYQDYLTGLYNYYYFHEILETEYLKAARHASPLSLIMMDVDNFKNINDTLGHPVGDLVLQEMGNRIRETLRRSDIACRYGGEEFAILLPHTNYEGGQDVAKRVKERLCGEVYQNGDTSCHITVTMGISSLEEPEAREAKHLVRLADEALLDGKSRGKDCIVPAYQLSRRKEIDATTLEDYRRRLITTEKNLKRAYMDSTKALLRALESKDNYSAVHSCLVATYAWHFTGVLNLPPEEREVIKNASLLYDLGKISIPDAILMKKGTLTSDEFTLVKQHPYYGASVVKGIKFLEQEVPIILHHHERWDGQGYPDGLKGKDIPLGARILALADTYEAVTSARPYRKGRPPEEAFKILREESGRQFDPELVEPFIKAMKEFLSTTSRVYISQLNRTVAIASS